MLFVHAAHDFTDNFLNAEGYSDSFMASQMLKDEIAKLIVDNKGDVIRMLRQNGFNASVNDNNMKVAAILYEAMGKNETLLSQVSARIVEKNIDETKAKELIKALSSNQIKIKAENKLNADSKIKIDWQELAKSEDVKKAVNDLVQKGLNKIVNAGSGTGTNDPSADEELASIQQRIRLNELKKGKFPMWAKITIGVLVAGGLAVAGYFIFRKKGDSAAVDATA